MQNLIDLVSDVLAGNAHRAAEAKRKNGNWFPASNGTETMFTSRSGKVLLYVWQPSTGDHAYLDCGSDRILTHEEADIALGMV